MTSETVAAAGVSTIDKLYLSCGCIVLLLHTTHALRRTPLSALIPSACGRLQTLAVAAKEHVRFLLRPKPTTDADGLIKDFVHRHLAMWREEQTRHAVTIVCEVLCINTLVALVQVVLQQERWMSSAQSTAYLVAYALSVMVDAMPQLAGRWTHAMWYSMNMGLACCTVMPFAVSQALLPVTMLVLALPRLLIGSFSCNILLFTFWNTVLSSTACYSYAWGAGNEHALGPLGFHSFVIVEMFACAQIIITFSVTVSTKAAEKRREIESRAVRREHSAMGTLLDTFCDVVVELDEEFRIVDDARKFGSMLLHGADRSLTGVAFLQFVPSEQERRHFISRMSSPEATGSMAQAFHMRLRDSLSNDMDMELFHVQFEGLDGLSRHLVGMREFTDAPGGPRPRTSQDRLVLPEFRSPPLHSAGTPSVAASCELVQHPFPRSTSECSQHDITLALPHFQPTRDEAKVAQVLEVLGHWNVSMLGSSCCNFHTSLRELTRVLAQLERTACAEHFAPLDGWQCPSCGLLDVDSSGADVENGLCRFCRSANWSWGRLSASQAARGARLRMAL